MCAYNVGYGNFYVQEALSASKKFLDLIRFSPQIYTSLIAWVITAGKNFISNKQLRKSFAKLFNILWYGMFQRKT